MLSGRYLSGRSAVTGSVWSTAADVSCDRAGSRRTRFSGATGEAILPVPHKTTDMVQIRLDYVYSIFIIFLAAICVRLAILAGRLVVGDHEAALSEFTGTDVIDEVAL